MYGVNAAHVTHSSFVLLFEGKRGFSQQSKPSKSHDTQRKDVIEKEN